MPISVLLRDKLALVDTLRLCGRSVFRQGNTEASITLDSFEVRPTPESLLTNVATINLVTSPLSNNISSDRPNEISLLNCSAETLLESNVYIQQLTRPLRFLKHLVDADISYERCKAALNLSVKEHL